MFPRHAILFNSKNSFIRHLFFRRFKSSSNQKYDIVIVGGGMVGFSMAASLGINPITKGLRILLLESMPKDKLNHSKFDAAYSNRVVALSSKTRAFLEDLSAWSFIQAHRFHPVKQMFVWESQSDAFISFDKDHLQGDLAYIVENDLVLQALVTSVLNNTGINVEFQSKVAKVHVPTHPNTQPISLTLSNGNTIDCTLMIGADGHNSMVRDASNIKQKISWKHDKAGIVATLNLNEGNDSSVAWQRFLSNGPIAYLPLNEKQSSLVWSTSSTEAKQLLQLTENEFVEKLNHAMWQEHAKHDMIQTASGMLDTFLNTTLRGGAPKFNRVPPTVHSIVPSSRAAFPLGFSLSSQFVDHRIALIGDAAHRVLPLAGQGVNLGFGDVEALTQVLADIVHEGGDIGNLDRLHNYQTNRWTFVAPMALTIEALQWLYSSEFPPLVMGRTLGLKLCNGLIPVKNFLVNSATSGQIKFK